MNEIFRHEWRHMLRPALAWFALTLVGYLVAIISLDKTPALLYDGNTAILNGGIGGLLIGVYQALAYRRDAQWAWLALRPIGRPALFGGFALSGLLATLFGVALPHLLLTVFFAATGRDAFDSYHLLLILIYTMLAWSCWAAGVTACWHPRHLARLIVLGPVIPSMISGSLEYILLAYTIMLVLMLGAAYTVFGTDRAAATRTPGAIIVQLFLLLPVLGLLTGPFATLAGRALFRHAYVATSADTARDFWESPAAWTLRNSPDPAMADWRNKLMQSNEHLRKQLHGDNARAAIQILQQQQAGVKPYAPPAPTLNGRTPQFTDPHHQVRWRFNFDAMRFHGSDMVTGGDRGWFGMDGPGSSRPYREAPHVEFANDTNAFIMTSDHVWHYEYARGLDLIQQAPPGEHFVSPPLFDTMYSVAPTTSGVLVSPFAKALADGKPPIILHSDEPMEALQRIDLNTFPELSFITLTFTHPDAGGAARVHSVTYTVDLTQAWKQVAEARFTLPPLKETAEDAATSSFWNDPISAVHSYQYRQWNDGLVDQHYKRDWNTHVQVHVVARVLGCLLLGLWLLRSPISSTRKFVWFTAAFVLGPVIFLCMLAVEKPRTRMAAR